MSKTSVHLSEAAGRQKRQLLDRYPPRTTPQSLGVALSDVALLSLPSGPSCPSLPGPRAGLAAWTGLKRARSACRGFPPPPCMHAYVCMPISLVRVCLLSLQPPTSTRVWCTLPLYQPADRSRHALPPASEPPARSYETSVRSLEDLGARLPMCMPVHYLPEEFAPHWLLPRSVRGG